MLSVQIPQWLTPGSPLFGYTLAAALGLTSAIRAIINAHSGYQLVGGWVTEHTLKLGMVLDHGID